MSGNKTADITCKQSWNHRRPLFNLMQGAAIAVCLIITNAGLVFSRDVLSEGGVAIAADPSTIANASLQPAQEPLDLSALNPANTPAGVVTADTISQTHLTVPSLWWRQEQTDSDAAYGSKLIVNWLAYPNNGNRPGRVDLVVNRQFWSLLDYLDRYAFIHAFGKAARDYGYNVRVFDGRATLLGASTCDFSAININALQDSQVFGRSSQGDRFPSTMTASLPSLPTDSIVCNILLDSSGKGGLRGGSKQLSGGGAAKALDTPQP